MFEGTGMLGAKHQLANDQNPPQVRAAAACTLPSHYRQQVVKTVFDVAAEWARQTGTFPSENDLVVAAKSLMAVISVVESDQ